MEDRAFKFLFEVWGFGGSSVWGLVAFSYAFELGCLGLGL